MCVILLEFNVILNFEFYFKFLLNLMFDVDFFFINFVLLEENLINSFFF